MTIIWALFAAVCLAAELFTGTLYLLVLCIATAVACGLAALDCSIMLQVAATAVLSLLGIGGVHYGRSKLNSATPTPSPHKPEAIVVTAEDTRYRVRWRGTEWNAEGPAGLAPETRVAIVGQAGNTLHIAPR